MLLRAEVPRNGTVIPKKQSRNSPAHTSQEMQILLLDMMSRSQGKTRTVAVCRITLTVFGVMKRKHQDRKPRPDRKQNPVKKDASRGSSKRKTVLQKIRKSRTMTVQAVKHRTVFSKSRMLLQRRTERNRPGKQKISGTITAAGTLTSRARKRADTAGGNIRTGNARKHLISGVISRQRIMISQKKIPLQRVRNRSFMEAKN